MSCDMSSLFFATRGREVISYIFFLFTLSFVVKKYKNLFVLCPVYGNFCIFVDNYE